MVRCGLVFLLGVVVGVVCASDRERAARVNASIAEICRPYLPALDVRALARQVVTGNAAAREAVRAQVYKKDFYAAMAGHSVCAGHGNFFNESYAAVLDVMLRRGFGAAGLKARAENFGMGGASSLPLAWCVQSTFGPGVSLVGWDFMMTDGQNSRSAEVFARSAWSLGAIALFFLPVHDDRAKMLAKIYSDLPWLLAPSADELLKHLKKRTFVFSSSTGGQGGQGGQGVDDVLKEKFTPEALRDIAFHPKNEAQKHRKFTTPSGAPGRVAWHPGHRVHRLQASILAVYLLSELQEALLSSEPLSERPYLLPPPERPHCGDLSFACETPSKSSCATTYEPKRGTDLTNLVIPPFHWPLVLAKGDPSVRAEQLGLGYLDRKFTLEGQLSRGPLLLRLHSNTAPPARIVLCQANTGWRRPPDLADLDDKILDIALIYGHAEKGKFRRSLSLAKINKVPNCFRATGLLAGKQASSSPMMATNVDLWLNVTQPRQTVYLSHVVWSS